MKTGDGPTCIPVAMFYEATVEGAGPGVVVGERASPLVRRPLQADHHHVGKRDIKSTLLAPGATNSPHVCDRCAHELAWGSRGGCEQPVSCTVLSRALSIKRFLSFFFFFFLSAGAPAALSRTLVPMTP